MIVANKTTPVKGIIIIILIVALLLFASLFAPNYIMKRIYPLKYEDAIHKYANEFGLDPYLVMAVIHTESNFDPYAISNQNAKGLMQLTDSTARWCADELKIEQGDIFSPDFNIMLGCWYLNYLFNQFKYEETAIAAYNGGIGNVNQWLKNQEYSGDGHSLDRIPFRETENFVKRVTAAHKIYVKLYKQ